MQPNRFLRRRQVVELTGLSASTIFNLEKAGTFPQHFLITPRCAGWDEEAVVEWMRKRPSIKHAAPPVPDAKAARGPKGVARATAEDLL